MTMAPLARQLDTTKIEWEEDWNKALARARAENKTVLLDFFNPQ
jgi:uncharacterized protein YyaL (SSP411 family)